MKFDTLYEQILNEMKVYKGLENAYSKRMVIKKICDKCGYIMPKYKGRYPNFCPSCGDPVTKEDKEIEVEETDNIEEMPKGE